MKLRNKLIPLASVFATGAVLAPATLTSCSTASGMVDLTSGNYAATIKKAKTDSYEATEDLAMELWMSSINENPEVFIQDRYWSDAAMIKGFADYSSTDVTSIKGQCKDVSVKYVTIKDGSTDRKIPTVSMTYTLTVEANWSVTGYFDGYDAPSDLFYDDELPVEYRSYYGAQFGSPLYFPIKKYFYDYNVAGKMYTSYAYEAKWTNIPVAFYSIEDDFTQLIKKMYPDITTKYLEEYLSEMMEYLPKVVTEITDWTIRPSIDTLLLMDQSKLDWNYSVKYAKEDSFVFDKDGVETTKQYSSSLDRSFHSYEKLMEGPSVEESQYYTNAGGLLKSEAIASYYLSDLTKVSE